MAQKYDMMTTDEARSIFNGVKSGTNASSDVPELLQAASILYQSDPNSSATHDQVRTILTWATQVISGQSQGGGQSSSSGGQQQAGSQNS